ncbi:MAG: hypothetical protein AB9M53_00950 [Leptothrix sp. (in: b-proteobacteria)]
MSHLRIGRVAATNHADHSVDLVMVDDGSRLTGVQVLAIGASTNTGMVHLPEPTPTPQKWDLSQRTDRDALAVVGQMGVGVWVVLGFLVPQISQMTFEGGRYMHRLPSDVYMTVDGAGNSEFHHPSGAYVRLAETPDHETLAGKNFDGNWSETKNTGKQVHLQVVVGGTKIHITPGGAVSIDHPGALTVNTGGAATVTAGGAVSVTAGGAATVHASTVTIDAPSTTCTGSLTVAGLLTYGGGLSGSGGSGATMSGNLTISGGNVTADGIGLKTHHHSGVQTGGGTTGSPTP